MFAIVDRFHSNGALLFFSWRLRKPSLPVPNARAALVFPRHRVSPAVCRGLREPWRSRFAAPGAGTLRLRLCACLPSQLRKPFRRRFALPLVLLRGPRNPSVSSAAPGATFGVSSRPSEPCRLARTLPCSAAVSSDILFVIPAKAGIRVPRIAVPCHSTNSEIRPLLSFPRKRESRRSVLPFLVIPRIQKSAPSCHSRESGNPGAPYCRSLSFHEFRNPPPPVIPAKAGIQALRFAFLYHSRNAVFAFNVHSRRTQIGNLQSIIRFRYSSAIYHAP